MAANKYPIINGNCFGANSVEIDLSGRTFGGISALNYADELQKEGAFGTGSVAIGVVTGQYTAKVDFEMLLHESKIFRQMLGPGYGMVPFNIGCTHFEQPGAGITTVEILGATISGLDTAVQRGSTATTEKYTLMVIVPIKRDGLTIVDLARGGADIASAALSLSSIAAV